MDGLTNKLNVMPVSQFEENGNLLKATGGSGTFPVFLHAIAGVV